MSLGARFLPATPPEEGRSRMSCLQEALDDGHPMIDQRIYPPRKSVKIKTILLYYQT